MGTLIIPFLTLLAVANGGLLTYLALAEDRFGDAAAARLEWWLDQEADILMNLPWRSAVH